tara:strand:- start:14651 stop:14923 length:273 start_codon:yes stop_codon:yes gene_type:complete
MVGGILLLTNRAYKFWKFFILCLVFLLRLFDVVLYYINININSVVMELDLEKRVRNRLLMRGFSEKDLVNNRGLVGAVMDEVILDLVKNK